MRRKYYPLMYWGNGNRLIDKRMPFAVKRETAHKIAMGNVKRFFSREMWPHVKTATRKSRYEIRF